jgi:GNAT superfamily N-acetyltransferase
LLKHLDNAAILNQNPFLADEVQFNLFHMIISAPDAIFAASANGKALITQNPATTFPAWIWTDAAITPSELTELASDCYALFAKDTKLAYIAKPEIAQYLAEDYAGRRKVSFQKLFTMGAYYCPKINPPRTVSGELTLPTLAELNQIAAFFVGFQNECFGEQTTATEQIDKAQQAVADGNCYAWKAKGELVAMASIAHRSSRYGRIGMVYTLPLQRQKGYASALVARLSQKVLDEGLTPMLYTDLTNPHSNKIYQSIGYRKCGELSHIAFK